MAAGHGHDEVIAPEGERGRQVGAAGAGAGGGWGAVVDGARGVAAC